MKASAVLSFLRFSAWPPFPARDFTVGVLGRPSFAQALVGTLQGKSVGDRAVHVIQLTLSADLACCQRQGWNVTMAANGKEAYEYFLTGPFDLVLMDIQMPVMDGLEATRLIRRYELETASTRRTPVVALTAHASTQHQAQCRNVGMDEVITKPFSVASLLRGIAAAIPENPASATLSAASGARDASARHAVP